uniref:G-patch domain-containing protein n=1 Tax=Bursaphelenchus xylophilus TaxID=6326 RepID=A0A1I7SVN0_BURXY
MSLAKYGTAHENLEDEKNTAVSRRPTAIQDEIVTDEKGRRRFHGAFTGGFSAGYFNTVGSRHGWVPQTFRSSRDERPDEPKRSVDDFMDDEDRGEFGFAHQKIRTKSNFMAQLNDQSKNAPLAWERAGPSTSDNFNDLAMTLASTFQGVNDSIGVKILKKMGWRPGKGIGPRMKRRQLERQKVNDARQLGRSAAFNSDEVEAMEELAPEAEYAPDDIPRLFLQPNQGEHGLGYRPLEKSNVLEEDFLMKVDAYKEKAKSKGIRGQAFGVGAFEEDDDDVYANEDISKYDFAIGGDESEIREVERCKWIFEDFFGKFREKLAIIDRGSTPSATTEASTSLKQEPTETSAEETRRLAVQQKQFGPLTRQKFTWYPSKYLVKYFNVEDPYPESREEGCPDIVKKHLHRKDYSLDMLGLADTQKEVVDRIGREAHEKRRSRWEADKEPPKPMDKVFEAPAPETEKPTFLPPIALLQAVFEHGIDLESDEEEAPVDEPEISKSPSTNSSMKNENKTNGGEIQAPTTSKSPERFVTVLDLVESDDEYGPKIPDVLPLEIDPKEKEKIIPKAPDVIEIDDSSEESSEEESHRHKKRKRRDSEGEKRKKSKKNKKEKKKKEKKRKRRDT